MHLPRSAHLHLFALAGFAIAQPLYDLIGRNAEFLVAHDAGAGTIAALIVTLSVLIPLALAAIVEAARLARQDLAHGLHVTFVGCLTALIAAGALRQMPAAVALGLSAITGIVAAWAYQARPVRTFLTVVSPAILIFPLVFVFATPVSRLLPQRSKEQAGTTFERRPPIVLIVFDELDTVSLLDGTGRIDAARFPNFAALARSAMWFPNAIATYPSTRDALPAIVTGVDADATKSRLPIAADYPDNLFTWLRDSYALHVHESISRLCPSDACSAGSADTRAFARDVAILYLHLIVPATLAETRLPPLAFAWRDFGSGPAATAADTMTDEEYEQALDRAIRPGRGELFSRFVNDIDAWPDPTLHFAHILLPHDPYEYLPSGRRYDHGGLTAGISPKGTWTDDPPLIATGRQRHDAQVGFVDTLVGALIARLRTRNLFDRALVIVTSDHGSAFVPGQSHRGMVEANYRGLVAAPLFVKLPGQTAGRVDERRASGIDIVPTIAAVLGAALPWHADGRSLLAESVPERATLTYKGAGVPPLDAFDVREEARRIRSAAAPDPVAGQPLAAFDVVAGPPTVQVFSDGFRAVQSVSLDSGVLPALVQGRIQHDAGGAGPMRIAVAVNGVVQAATRTTEWYGQSHYFAALVPESALHDGRNQLDILSIETLGGRVRLTRLSPERSTALALRSTGGGERLVAADGGEIAIDPRIEGVVDSVVPRPDGSVTLQGWAADRRSGRTVRSVVVFAGGTAAAAAPPAAPRADVAAALGIAADTKVVYAVDVPAAALSRGAIRIFALAADDVAGAVQIPPQAQQTLERNRRKGERERP